MKIPSVLFALPFLTSSLLGQVAEEKKSYILASEDPPLPVGQTFKLTRTNSMNDFMMSIKVLGQERNSKMDTLDQKEELREYLTQDKLRMTILKSRKFKKNAASEPPEGEKRIGAAEGKTIIFEKKRRRLDGDAGEGKGRSKGSSGVR